LEFTDVDINAFKKVQGVDIDKNAYPNLYRWSLIVKKLSQSGKTGVDTKNTTNNKAKVVTEPLPKTETFNPPSSKNPCNLSSEELLKHEETLKTHSYLSQCSEPSQDEDAKVLAEFEKTKYCPDSTKYPNLHGWWWHLCCFAPDARAAWMKTGKK